MSDGCGTKFCARGTKLLDRGTNLKRVTKRAKLLPVCGVCVGDCSFVVSQCCLALLASDVVSVDLLAAAPAAFVPHSSWTPIS